MKKILSLIVLSVFSLLLFVGCRSYGKDNSYTEILRNENVISGQMNIDGKYLYNESYSTITEEAFNDCLVTPKSFFSMDSFTASYSNLRRYINSDYELNGNVILTDELINYFDYDFKKPEGNETFAITSELGVSPWNSDTKLLTVAVTTKDAEIDGSIGNNYVFLLDISGSMAAENKLPLIKESMKLLLEQLSDKDTISIVTYANKTNVICEGLNKTNSKLIKSIDSLKASGGTSGSDGIEKSYTIAQKYYIENGNNRVILCTDGDFNIGKVSGNDLNKLISEKRDTGIYLTCLGFGMDNYDAITLETLAKNGNGGYAYIDSEEEAHKIFVKDFTKTMYVVAKDVKTCVEFNPNVVASYRLLGYENKHISEEEFNDESKDAGEIGSGHTSVVCYEVILKDNIEDANEKLANVQIKYKDPKDNTSLEKTEDVSQTVMTDNTDNFKFVSNVVTFSLMLRNSPYVFESTCEDVINSLNSIESIRNDEYKMEFINLVTIANSRNLVANPNYDLVRVVRLYTDIGVQYIKVDRNIVIDKDSLANILNINMDLYDKFDFYLDSDYTNILDSYVVNDNVNIYLKINNTKVDNVKE